MTRFHNELNASNTSIALTTKLAKTALALAVAGVSLTAISAQAALSINESERPGSSKTGSAKITWGGADSLSEARTIMYSNTSGNNTIRKVDNGYSGNGSTSGSSSLSFGTSQYSNNYGSSYSSGYNSYGDTLPISTGSRGVMVVDVATGQPLYEKNAHAARPIASITKLMTAMVILDAGQDMREEIVLESIDFVGPKKASSRLRSGDRMNRAELLLMTLMKSENPAAKSLARHYPGGYDSFMAAMNAKARSLGMTTAFFGDPTGLDKRNVASPADLVKMVKAAGQYEVIRRFSTTTNHDFYVANFASGNRTYPARNTSYLVRDKAYPIGISKTGFINEAGKCVVMETSINNRPAIVVLLGAGSTATRWKDAETILNSLAVRRSI